MILGQAFRANQGAFNRRDGDVEERMLTSPSLVRLRIGRVPVGRVDRTILAVWW